jgi:hypothetical protein
MCSRRAAKLFHAAFHVPIELSAGGKVAPRREATAAHDPIQTSTQGASFKLQFSLAACGAARCVRTARNVRFLTFEVYICERTATSLCKSLVISRFCFAFLDDKAETSGGRFSGG